MPCIATQQTSSHADGQPAVSEAAQLVSASTDGTDDGKHHD